MRTKSLVWLAVVTVAALTLFSLRAPVHAAGSSSHPAASAAEPAPAPQPAVAAAQPLAEPDPQARRYPNIYAALHALQNARDHLQDAVHHYGGHRAKALDRANDAINQCQQAIKWANHH